MKKSVTDIVFVFVILLHLLTRQWPYGGPLQTVIDGLIVAALFLTLLKSMNKRDK